MVRYIVSRIAFPLLFLAGFVVVAHFYPEDKTVWFLMGYVFKELFYEAREGYKSWKEAQEGAEADGN